MPRLWIHRSTSWATHLKTLGYKRHGGERKSAIGKLTCWLTCQDNPAKAMPFAYLSVTSDRILSALFSRSVNGTLPMPPHSNADFSAQPRPPINAPHPYLDIEQTGVVITHPDIGIDYTGRLATSPAVRCSACRGYGRDLCLVPCSAMAFASMTRLSAGPEQTTWFAL